MTIPAFVLAAQVPVVGMWKAVGYVAGGFSLTAFIVAAISWTLRAQINQRQREISLASDAERGRLVSKTLEFFDVPLADVSEDRRYGIAMAQIKARSERFKTVSKLVVTLALAAMIAALIAYSTYLIKQQDTSHAQPNVPVVSPTADSLPPAARTTVQKQVENRSNVEQSPVAGRQPQQNAGSSGGLNTHAESVHNEYEKKLLARIGTLKESRANSCPTNTWYGYVIDFTQLGNLTIEYIQFLQNNPEADKQNRRITDGLEDALNALTIRNQKGTEEFDTTNLHSQAFPEEFGHILELLKTRKANHFSADDASGLESAIRGWYKEAGFPDATVVETYVGWCISHP